jgi:hypothetical protein
MTEPKGKGRPSSYKPEFAEQARKLCELGATDIELADFFNVSDRSIYRWSNEHDDFCQALKAGKEAADERVVRALYHKATGYTHDAVKVLQYEGSPVIIPYREHVAPDTTAAIFWLKNRRRTDWRDRVTHEGDAENPIAIEEIPTTDRAKALANLLLPMLAGVK